MGDFERVFTETRPWQSAEALALRAVESSGDGILAFDTDLRITLWNPQMERMSGFCADEALGRAACDVFPPLAAHGDESCLRETLAGHATVTRDSEYTASGAGALRYLEVHCAPLQDAGGGVTGGMAIVRDVTDRRRSVEAHLEVARVEAARAEAAAAAHRFAFLARASEVLSSSLDYERTLRELARLVVPELADVCIVDVVEDGRLRRVAALHVNPDKARLLEELCKRYPPHLDSPQPAARVVRSGVAELLAYVTPDVLQEHTWDRAHAEMIGAIGIRSHLAIPLFARGSMVGVMSLGVTESARRYGPADEALGSELARRAAHAIDNARLYHCAHSEVAERRRAEEALRLSESRFRAIMEQSPLSTQIFAPDGRLLRVNRAWEELWGVTLEQIPGYNVLEDPQLEALGVAPAIRRAFSGETVEMPAVRYEPEQLPDQAPHRRSARWVRAFAYAVKDVLGVVREVVLVHEDVTDRVRADARVRASEERLRIALSAGRLTVWEWDLITNRIDCSGNAREFWGRDVGQAEEFIAMIHPEDRERVLAAFRGVGSLDQPYACEYRLLGKDRAMRWVQSRGRADSGDGQGNPHVVGVTVDISELKAAQEATRVLADAGETLGASLDPELTLQNLAQVVVPRLADWCAIDLLTEDGTLERVSLNHSNAERLALVEQLSRRYPPRRSDPHGPWSVLATGQPVLIDIVEDALLDQIAQDPEHLGFLRALGLRSYMCVPLVARGCALGVLTLAVAESGRRYRAEQLELAKDLAHRAAIAVDNARLHERLRTEDRRKDEFLATLAHELRNPLAPIRNGLEILRLAKPGVSTERTREIMERQIGHMVRLIDDLLDLSRVSRGTVQIQKELIDLSVLLSTAIEVSRPLLDAACVELVVRYPEEPVLFVGDRTRLAQVVSNLLNNAAKYTERGGRVELDARQEGAELVISIKDNGVGIPREMLNEVFEMFAQVGRTSDRRQGGLGIGLTLVKRLVELHGGRVWAESAGPGQGSTFVVRLPLGREGSAALHASAPPARARARAASPLRILVVDDNVDAAQTLAALLEMEGHDVRIAASAPAALDILRAFEADAAFLDIGLPGMNGYELARAIREEPRLSGMRLIAVTGWGKPEDRRRSAEAGFDDHLTKPVQPDEVHAALKPAGASRPLDETLRP